MKQGKKAFACKLESITGKIGSLSYIPPVKSPPAAAPVPAAFSSYFPNSVSVFTPPLSLCFRISSQLFYARKELFNGIRRLDLLQELIEDPLVTEIMVNGHILPAVLCQGRQSPLFFPVFLPIPKALWPPGTARAWPWPFHPMQQAYRWCRRPPEDQRCPLPRSSDRSGRWICQES